jgi:phosphoribosylformylglycinamidine synthase
MPAVVELTPDIARLVGYYLSEGCVTGTAPRIVLAFHRDETDAKQDVLKLLGSLGIEGKTYEDPNFLTTQIRVGHHLFAVLLRDVLGCGANSYDAKVPSQLMGASAVHRRELLAGLLRGDGSVWTENKRRTYRKGTQEYTHDFRSAEAG